ncbi:MAG: T9SS type A sorting domain-containing protein, partial [Flavobacteriales bacterium]
ASGGFFTNLAGGTIGAPFHLLTSSMNIEGALTLNSFLFTGGGLHGPQALTIGNGGQFTWTGGTLATTAILTLAAGATGTLNGATLIAQGTINNGGQVTMQSGILTGMGSTPCTFNNLAGGVVNLNGWNTSQAAWHMVTNNAGTFNKNNGAENFTFGNDFSFKSFTNQAGGVVNVPAGTLTLNVPLPLQDGTFTVSNGATLTGTNAFNFAGPTILNNGSITTPVLRYQGTSAQQLNGTGTLTSLAIDNATGVDLGGDQTVTNTLTMTNGQLRLGNNDLFVENNALGAVAGGNATSWVVNNGTGSLHRQVIGSGYLFPVGTTSYTPLTLGITGPQDRFSVRVQDGVSTNYGAPGEANGAPITARAVGRTWVVAEQVGGGNTGDITVQWNASDELPQFNRNLCAVSRYDGTDWQTGTFAAALGAGPFTRALSGVNAFREFSVGDNLLNLNTALDDLDAQRSAVPLLYPQPADQVLHVVAPEGGMFRGIRLFDASGRLAGSTSFRSEHAVLDVSALPPGVYVLEWTDDRLNIGRTPVMVSY